MARKGRYTKSPEWWKHLKWAKRTFWKAERKAAKQDDDNDSNWRIHND